MATTGIPHYDALVGVHTVIAALATAGSLTGITGANPLASSQVHLKMLPTDRAAASVTPPCVVVSAVPQPETNERAPNVYEDWGYPCGVTIVIPKNQEFTIDKDELGWRQIIRNSFHNKQPSAVVTELGTTPLKICRVEPGPVLDLSLFRDENLFVSFLLVRVVTRETR